MVDTGFQLTLDHLFEPAAHGGKRAGAGRPRGTSRVPHRTREEFAARYPLHVTLSCVPGVSLRRWSLMSAIHAAIAGSHTQDFRMCELNIESNHMHFIAEADGRGALAHGLQRFKRVLAGALNQSLGRSGALFVERYHDRVLMSPTVVRNAVRYVLNNARHHAAEWGQRLDSTWFDPYSSAAWFTGWAAPLVAISHQQRALLAQPSPMAPPQTWLLRTGWRQLGLIGLDEIPGSRRSLRLLEQREAELAHQSRMREIDLEWRYLRGELIR